MGRAHAMPHIVVVGRGLVPGSLLGGATGKVCFALLKGLLALPQLRLPPQQHALMHR